eukprot:2906406-Rhodomonas_salina.1
MDELLMLMVLVMLLILARSHDLEWLVSAAALNEQGLRAQLDLTKSSMSAERGAWAAERKAWEGERKTWEGERKALEAAAAEGAVVKGEYEGRLRGFGRVVALGGWWMAGDGGKTRGGLSVSLGLTTGSLGSEKSIGSSVAKKRESSLSAVASEKSIGSSVAKKSESSFDGSRYAGSGS